MRQPCWKKTNPFFNEPTAPNESLTVQNHEMRLHELNTLEWDDLVVTNDSNDSTEPRGGKHWMTVFASK